MTTPLVPHPWDSLDAQRQEAEREINAEIDRILDLIRQGDEKDAEASDLEDEAKNLRTMAEDLWEEADKATTALGSRIPPEWVMTLTLDKTDPRA